MGFISSSLLLVLLGWLSSYLYRKYLRKRNKDWIFFMRVMIILGFWFVELSIYLEIINMSWLNSIPWINIPLYLPTGKYYLWNSFLLFGIDFHIYPAPELFSIAAILLLAYPLWYELGLKFGRILHGYYTHEEGILWILKPIEKVVKEREQLSRQRKNQ
ncbi:MAG: hypothetical protein ACTSO9_11270 [Candidatus Helarchaeota archaeon]